MDIHACSVVNVCVKRGGRGGLTWSALRCHCQGTPYCDLLFVFDIMLPPSYPSGELCGQNFFYVTNHTSHSLRFHVSCILSVLLTSPLVINALNVFNLNLLIRSFSADALHVCGGLWLGWLAGVAVSLHCAHLRQCRPMFTTTRLLPSA